MFIPQPDIVFRPSAELENMIAIGAMPEKVEKAIDTLEMAPGITEIEFRVHEVFIFDNRDPGKGDIYLITVVTDDVSPAAIRLEVKTFEDIADNSALLIGPGGLTIYRNPAGKIPRYLDYRILVMESDQELRDAGAVVDQIAKNDQFKKIRDNVVALASTTQPVTGLITAAADLVVGLIAQLLKSNKDDQIVYIAGSFNDKIDELGVKYGSIAQKNSYGRVNYMVHAE